MSSAEDILARIFARRDAAFRWTMGKVTSTSPLRVLPEGMLTDVGPLPLVRSLPALNAQVPLVWIAGLKQWAVIGDLSAPSALMLPYAFRVLGESVYKPWIAFVSPDDVVTLERAVGAEDFNRNYGLAKHESPHIFRMSDGACLLFVNRPNNNTGYFYMLRSPDGVWSSPVLLMNDPLYGFNEADAHFVQGDGDIVYAFLHGYQPLTASLFRLAYSSGAVSVLSTAINPAVATILGWGVYYDSTNDLVHVWYGDEATGGSFNTPETLTPSTNYLDARNATTLALVYSASGPKVRPYNYAADGTDMDGDGAEFFCGTMTTFWSGSWPQPAVPEYRVFRVVAGPSSYTTGPTQESGLAYVPITYGANYAACVWDGSNLNLIACAYNAGLFVARRTGVNSYSAWTDITDSGLYVKANGKFASASLGNGDIAVAYVARLTVSLYELHFKRRVGDVWGSAVVVLSGGTFGDPSSNRVPHA